ncbi:trehalase [Thecamonas trahens ATCC 50062]|uniref:Trehalase n=1 Tax=Thecamonas trahens ATCC 50062 TaxID=461836 RepID=A0A0L0DIU5_THETB|nr:trehalase [Thecamonas trahens ATCC 50062]KNC52222.1 trehalase [Thecamonas trahens ATCC 50062]|eukprot:XP_013762225.1 trehalase [Thecamonas trahens ATCC 50062]
MACFADTPPCDSALFCSGPLLHAFQLSGLFNDSKTFVDAPLLPGVTPADVLGVFDALSPSQKANASVLHAIYLAHYDEPGSDLEAWLPPDWQPHPPLVAAVAARSPSYGAWAADLNALWHTLGRKVVADVEDRPDAHSLLYVPNGFVVPGGRFREWYNWDTFWILRGLLECGLTKTVAGMLENFGTMVETFGFVPNGGRRYYIDRSQPPLFALMVAEYYDATHDLGLVSTLFPLIAKEYGWWMTERVVTTSSGEMLNIYRPKVGMPRPEGYVEDLQHAQGMGPVDAACLYAQIAAGAETGWDFSTRWFATGSDISSICVSSLAPVDLNAFLFQTETTLARLATVLGRSSDAAKYAAAANRRAQAFDAFFWNEAAGQYVDYNVSAASQVQPPHSDFYVASMIPIWAGLASGNASRSAQIRDALQGLGVLDFAAGIPTSLATSGQQWDMPNAWAPMQFFSIYALEALGEASLATQLAKTWLASNYAAYNSTGLMWEKYNVLKFGKPGGGGEYTVATGFGWTNGVPPHSDFYVASMIPIWAGLASGNASRSAQIRDALQGLGVLDFAAGIPTSLATSGQQWDMPNAWAPMQFFSIYALEALGEASLATQLAKTWLASNYAAYNSTGLMWEKYNVLKFGKPGGGGEYTVATGFGWTNGVALALLRDYFT